MSYSGEITLTLVVKGSISTLDAEDDREAYSQLEDYAKEDLQYWIMDANPTDTEFHPSEITFTDVKIGYVEPNINEDADKY